MSRHLLHLHQSVLLALGVNMVGVSNFLILGAVYINQFHIYLCLVDWLGFDPSHFHILGLI